VSTGLPSATGRIGVSSLRELIRSPQFQLVGVYVHSEAKVGVPRMS